MIQPGTKNLKFVDNLGILSGNCFRVSRRSGRSSGKVGNQIMLSVRSAQPTSRYKKGSKHYAIVVATKKKRVREDGSTIQFNYNGVVLVGIKGKEKEVLGTAIRFPVDREVRKVSPKIASLTREVW